GGRGRVRLPRVRRRLPCERRDHQGRRREAGVTDGEQTFASAHTASFPQILQALGVSLVVSTYQSGRVIAVREDNGTLNTHFRLFDQPMGLAYAAGRLVIAANRSVWDYRDQPAVAARVEPAGKHDAC